ncbi:MAG: hypothetical protein ACFFF4_06715 [Candidatus Thorarchaeota archaeon]
MQTLPGYSYVYWIIPITLLLLAFSIIRISATWIYRFGRSRQGTLSWFSRFGKKLANGGDQVFNGLNMTIALSSHGIILTFGFFFYLNGWGIGYLFPILFTLIGIIFSLGFIRFSKKGKRWYSYVKLEIDYFESHSEDSIIEGKIKSLVDVVNQGTPSESKNAISELEYLLRLGYDFGATARTILSKIDSELYSEYVSTPIRRLSRLKVTFLFLIVGFILYFFSVIMPFPSIILWSIQIEYTFRILLSNYFMQPLFLVFGYEGSLDTKFV